MNADDFVTAEEVRAKKLQDAIERAHNKRRAGMEAVEKVFEAEIAAAHVAAADALSKNTAAREKALHDEIDKRVADALPPDEPAPKAKAKTKKKG